MNYYVTTMSQEYFNALGYKTLQTWLKNCQSGKIVLYSENFTPVWPTQQQITHWDDAHYNRLEVRQLTLSDEWNKLRQSLTGRAKNFVWKAAAWTSAVNEFKGIVTFFDADLICFQDPKFIIDTFIQQDYDISYMSVKDVRPHADSCFYSVNTEKNSAHIIVDEYTNQYLNETANQIIYPKPYDAPVLSKTIDLLQSKLKVWDFNGGSDAKSPLKDTILVNYFRHLKGNQKDSGRVITLIDKAVNAIDKGKSIEENLLRFDRKLRQDDSKKLDVPF